MRVGIVPSNHTDGLMVWQYGQLNGQYGGTIQHVSFVGYTGVMVAVLVCGPTKLTRCTSVYLAIRHVIC